MKHYRTLPDTPLETLEEYREFQGGLLVEQLEDWTPDQVLAELVASGLRGRGGGGFPTGRKWQTLVEHPCPTKYVVINAAEGEPGTFKDRWLLRLNPYVVLEGALLAAHALGASDIYIGIKAVYRQEIERFTQAAEEFEDGGFLDEVDVHIIEGPDEYLFGEEKAMLQVIEGQGPFPREPHYPPYEWGIEATPSSPNPTLVQNVETLARAATILLHGADGFAGLGRDATRGYLLVTLSGAVRAPGIYEVEAGRSLRSVLEKEAGGPRGARPWVGVLPGVAHPVLLAHQLDTPLGHEAFASAGSGLGAGGFLVLDDAAQIPEIARAVTRFLAVESCGQCHACKLGLTTASEELSVLVGDDGADSDHLRRIEEWARSAPNGNRCNLPVQAAEIVPSLLEDFQEEFSHSRRSKAAPFVLPKFLDYDAEAQHFEIDRSLGRKQLDWSYAEPPAQVVVMSYNSKQPKDSGSEEHEGFAGDEDAET